MKIKSESDLINLLPVRVGRKRQIAVLDNTGHEIVIFNNGQEWMAEEFVKFINEKYMRK